MVKFLVKKGANKKAKDEVGTVNTLLPLTALYLYESKFCSRCLQGALPIREKKAVSTYGRM